MSGVSSFRASLKPKDHNMDQARNCEGCTMCCILLPVVEIQKPPKNMSHLVQPVVTINKPPNIICDHCEVGCEIGCKIYENRPKMCVDFQCLWILHDDMGEDLKPSNCNVIFEKIRHTEIYLALVHFEQLDAWQEKPARDYIQVLNDKGFPLIVTSYTRAPKTIFLPKEGWTEEQVKAEVVESAKKLKNGST